MATLPLVLIACGGGPDPQATSRQPLSAVIVTRDDRSLPSGCRPREVAELIQGFFESFNRGEPSAAQVFAPELAPELGWFSVTEGARGPGRRHFVARDRGTLSRYLAARHRRRERLRLIEVSVGYSRGLGQIGFKVDRRADDLRGLGIRTRRAGGKGAIDCRRRKIAVWSMGMPHDRFRLCPRPAAPTRSPVACGDRS